MTTKMNSSSPGLREDVLIEAVRAIKNQRQRPSLDRVCRWLRFHKQVRRLEVSVVAAALETAVAKGTLHKDVKEGREAYREWKKTPRERRPGVKLSIASAICQCIQQFGGSEGLALDRICDHVMKMVVFQDMDPLVLKYHVRMHCLKAVKRGKLLREGRCYKLVRSGQIRWNLEDKKSEADLSFLVDRAVTNKRPVTPIEICSLCLDSEEKNRTEEELIYCVECGRGGHPSCLKFSSSLTEKVKTMSWQCIECKRCSVCADSSRGHSMLFCDSCDRGFHMDCCSPPIRKRPRGVWICCICDYEMDHSNSLRCLGNSVHQSGGSKRKCFNGAIRKSGSNRSGSFLIKRRNSLTNSSTDFGSDDGNFESNESAAQTLPFPVSKDDEECYRLAQLKVSQKLLQEHQLLTNDGATLPEMKRTGPLWIEFGKYEVMTWYSSPYPDGYTKLSKLYICEYCVRYMESRTILERHLTKCLLLRPPGDEIYRDGNLSVFEVDGNVAQIYCQNLCLLAKLFLDHKTLYYDVEPFLFYILTLNDSDGCHLVGYFSKEKYCAQKYNLSCIMVLPQYQRHGYGRLLIDFSYLLSRVEGRTGTPEKPLSDLGQLTYQSYWKEAITSYLEQHVNQTVTIKGIGDGTGICEQDVVATLQLLSLLVAVDQNRLAIVMDGGVASKPVRPSEGKSGNGRIVLDPGRLQWKPFVSTSVVQTEESETFQELKELSRLVDEIRDDRRRVEMLSPSVRLSRSSSLCSPPRKKARTSPVQLPNGSCNSNGRTGFWRSKSETVGSSPVEAVPLTCSTPLTSERLGLWRTRSKMIGLSPVADKQSDACLDREALWNSLKTGADGDRSDHLMDSFPANNQSDPTKPRRRKKRGWVKGRKRGSRLKDSAMDHESAETSDAMTERDHDLRNKSSVIVIHSSVEHTECYEVVSVSAEDQTSNAAAHDKLPPQDVETTEIYEIDRKYSAVEKSNMVEVVVDSSMEVEKPGKENIRSCDEGCLRVIDSSVEIVRNAVTLASGDLSDAQSYYSRVECDSGDHDRDVTFERPSFLSDSDTGNSPVADLLEVRMDVHPHVEQSCAGKSYNLIKLKDENDEVVDDLSRHTENVKHQVIGDIGRREEETNERKCQDVDDTSQQDMISVDLKCQTVTDFSQNEVTTSVIDDTSEQEVPRNNEKCSFVVESTNSDVDIAVDQGTSEDFRFCDSLPNNNKDANSKRTDSPQITTAFIDSNKFDFSYDTDSFGGNTDNGRAERGDGSTDDVGLINIARREMLSVESNECGPLLKDGKASKSSSLHTNRNRSAMKRNSIKRKNGKYCQTLFFQSCWNRELYRVDNSKMEILNGWLPDCSSTNNFESRAEVSRIEEVGRGDENTRKSMVEIDCVLNGNKDIAENSRNIIVEVDCVLNSIEVKELAENTKNSMVETDCVLNGNTEIKELAENSRKSMVEVDCVLIGNKEIKELVENDSMGEVDCVLNGNIELKEDGERTWKSANPPECLETLVLDSSTYCQNHKIAESELVTPVYPVINADTNGVEKDLVTDWPDSVISKQIKTIELSNCCVNSVDDR